MSATQELEPTIVYRRVQPEDSDFFYKSWLDAYGLGSPMTVHVPKSIYYPAHRAVIARLMGRPSAQAVVASLADDPAVLIGFAMAELGDNPVLHFVYVKAAFRRMGIASGLIRALTIDPARVTFTHLTRDSLWLRAKFPKARFNPYLLEDSQWTAPK